MKPQVPKTNIDSVKKIIRNKFSQINLKHVKLVGCGCDNDAFLINNKFIFRIQRSKYGISHIESRLLADLYDYVTLKVPKVIFSGEYRKKHYFIYEIVPGIKLNKDILSSLSKKEVRIIFLRILKFLDELHGFPVRRALKAGIKKVNLKRYFKDILLKSREKVFIKLNENEINAINDIFEKYLGDPKNFEYTPSLVHADLSKDHIFYDYKIKKIIGVIDFGDIQINDPLWDLIYLGSFGKVFEDYINSRKDSYFIKKKINLFLLTRALYGLKKAIKKKDEKKFDEERKEINKRIKQFYSNIFHY